MFLTSTKTSLEAAEYQYITATPTISVCEEYNGWSRHGDDVDMNVAMVTIVTNQGGSVRFTVSILWRISTNGFQTLSLHCIMHNFFHWFGF